MQVTIVMPTYNEAENLAAIVKAVLEEIPEARILIADDNSPDGTGELADELAQRYGGSVDVLHRPVKEGLGAAYAAAFRHALERYPETEYIVQMDADFSHDPAYLGPMLAAAREADVVVASRYVHGVSIVNWPIHRLLVSWCGTRFARAVTGLPITDCTSGFKCWRTEALRTIGLDRMRSNGYVFQVETSFRAWRAGYALKDFPIIFHERRFGESKLSLNIALEAFWVVLRLGLTRLVQRRALRVTAGNPEIAAPHASAVAVHSRADGPR